ncbi:MAG: ComEC/Rec2 family competence protein [Candidatus Magasanikbacteria bacterium]|nr:ComEC/Rec2 family competence protein [Candidatus Magasanikbacteria bacterium]
MTNEGVRKIITSKNKTFLAFCFSFILGAGLFSLFDWHQMYSVYFYGVLFVLGCVVIIFWNNSLYRFVGLCLLFFIFGAWRFLITVPDCSDPATLCFYNDKTVTIHGIIAEEPDRRIEATYYTVAAENYQGRALVKMRNYPEYQYGERIAFACGLQAPKNQDDSTFRYDKYLSRNGIWSVCSFPNVAAMPIQNERFTPSVFLMKPILKLKAAVSEQMNRLWPEPVASFVAGILYGSKSGLPKELSDNFSRTGITHIIAVSGFNITIIATVLMSVLITIGLWRRQAFWVVIVVIILFTIFSGLSSSAVRAAVMGIVVLTGQYLGRLSRMATVLIFTAALMMLGNPYVALWDAGFQLSFLATLGLVYVSPILLAIIPNLIGNPSPDSYLSSSMDSRFRGNDSAMKVVNAIREPLISTLSAIIATTPLIMYQFGRLSLVAPLVNILVLWIIPWLMLFGFLALLASFVFFPLGQLIAWVGGIGLRYVILTATFFGRQSFSAINFTLPWWGMVSLYVCLLIVIQRSQPKNLPISQSPQTIGAENLEDPSPREGSV